MISKLMFLCVLHFCICLEDMTFTCRNRTSGNFYCCSNYVEKDGKCIACRIGFTSYEGQPCRKCSGNVYGHRCIFKCKCPVNQICHHINGCIGDPASDSISGINSTLSVYTASYPILTEHTSDADRSESVTLYGTAILGSTESTKHNGFQLELLIYSASVTGVILILVICFLCNKCYTKRKQSKASVTLGEETNQNDPSNENHDVFELSEGVYHTIDEDKISVSSINDNPYLEVVNGSSGSDSIKNDKGETASYPPPYCRKITTSVDKHPYENSRPESFESHDHISGIQEIDQDYLTPSKPTIDSSTRCETEILAMVHVETNSSSGSDNEKNDKNDGIDYLNPYQPLEKNNQTEKDHGYDIPLTGPIKLTLDNVIDQPAEQSSNYENNNTETF